jgi:dephospho-CoA kinase
MPSLAITGSIGSGKSLLLRTLTDSLRKRKFNVNSYSADDENRRLLREDQEVRAEIALHLGSKFLDSQGNPIRDKLRNLLLSDPVARKSLESILHPRLRSIWLPEAERHRGEKSFFVAEIPLLYEKGLGQHFDRVLVIGCSQTIRKARLGSNRSLTAEQSDMWLSIQQPEVSKISLADHVFWNDGTPFCLERQVYHFLRILPPT